MTGWALAAAAAVLLAPAAPVARRPASGPAPMPRSSPVSSAGRRARRVLRRPTDPAADRWWGWTAVAVCAVLVTSPTAALAVPPSAAGFRWARRRAAERRGAEAVAAALPEVLELVAVAIRAGGTVRAAIVLVAERGPDVTGPAFRAVLGRAAAGVPLLDALDDLVAELGEGYRPLVSALVSAERDGSPLGAVVGQLAADAHDARRRAGEARARQVPVRLLLPLVCCTLPAVLIVTIVPLVAVGAGLAS